MPTFIIYLIKANIALTLFYLAYRFGLRRLTFYNLNRFFLLFGIAFSALFPLVNINTFFQQHEQLAGSVAYYTPDWSSMQLAQPQPFTVWSIIQYVFWVGAVVMTVRLSIQLLSLLRIHIRTKNGIIYHEKVKIMYDRINPFSFFKNIYINPGLHSPEELENILKHEKIHVKGWHTADVLAGEINNIFYWFNPGAWLMKTAIQENLEFITDRKILQSGTDAKAYQYNLIKVSTIPFAVPVANNFNFSHLKMRIKMMNKKKSSGFHLLRYLLLLPVIAIAALIINSSRAQTVSTKKAVIESTLKSDTLRILKKIPKNEFFNEKGYVIRVAMMSGETNVLSKTGVVLGPFNIFSMSPTQLADFNERFGSNGTYEQVQAIKNHADYLKAHPEISDYFYRSAEKILVWEGKSSKIYNLKNTYDRDELIRKFGNVPPIYGRFADGTILPKVKYTPPIINRDTIPLPYSSNSLPTDYVNFLRKNPSVKSLEWYLIRDKGPVLIRVELKNGKVESYRLDNSEGRQKAETMYGKIPAPPPPPPPAPTKIKSISSDIPANTNKKESKNLPSVVLIPTSLVGPQEDTMKKDDKFYTQIAYKAAQQKHYDWAENYAHQSLKLNPNNAKAKSILKYVEQVKSYQSKMEEYDKERGNNPLPKVKVQFTPPKVIITDSSEYFASVSEWEARKKNYNAATSYAQKSLQLNPNNAMAKQVLRYVNLMKGFQEKMEEYKKTHENWDSTSANTYIGIPTPNPYILTTTSSGITQLLPSPPQAWTIGSNLTQTETVGWGKYSKYNLNGDTKGAMNISSVPSLLADPFNRVKDTGEFPPKNVLYIVNGKKVDREFVHNLNSQSIFSISVLKDHLATREYGAEAKDGVIKILTKDYVKEHPGSIKSEMPRNKKNYNKGTTMNTNEVNTVPILQNNNPDYTKLYSPSNNRVNNHHHTIEVNEFINKMAKDGILNKKQDFKVLITSSALYVNGKKQDQKYFDKFRVTDNDSLSVGFDMTNHRLSNYILVK